MVISRSGTLNFTFSICNRIHKNHKNEEYTNYSETPLNIGHPLTVTVEPLIKDTSQ